MRYYSNASRDMTLTGAIDTVVTSMIVSDASGLPLTFPYNLAIDAGTSSVEIVEVTAAAGNTLTVVRGRQDTPAKTHSVGAAVFHAWTALDGQEAQDHFAATQNVHGIGVGSSVVGTATTQTLTNKSISGLTNTITNIPDSAIGSVDGSKITGVITVATIAVANVTGNWPIDTRSTGSLPLDTRTTGSIPVDTRTTGNLPGSRLASPVTAAITFSALATFSANVAVAQGSSAVVGLDVTPHASATAPPFRVVAIPGQPVAFRRNSSSVVGNLVEFQNESGVWFAAVRRDGKFEAQGFVDPANNFDLSNPPILRLTRTNMVVPNTSATQIDNYTVAEHSGGFSVAANGTITFPPFAARWLVIVNTTWESNDNGIRYVTNSLGNDGGSYLVPAATFGHQTAGSSSAVARFGANATFGVSGYQTSGVSLWIVATSVQIEYLGR